MYLLHEIWKDIAVAFVWLLQVNSCSQNRALSFTVINFYVLYIDSKVMLNADFDTKLLVILKYYTDCSVHVSILI